MFLVAHTYEILLPLAMILFISKALSIGCRRLGLPQLIGLLFTGVLLGLITLIPGQNIIPDHTIDGIGFIAEIGVILIMFNAGIETDLKQIKETGAQAGIVTVLGIVVPMGLGVLASLVLPPVLNEVTGETDMVRTIFRNCFYGVILTATSVSVTIAALKELGKLNTKIGTTIISAAILDDIIGVIILSIIVSLNGALVNGGANVGMEILIVFGKTIGFFIFAIGLGILIRMLFKKLANKYDHHRRIPIFAIALAFFYSYIAEKVFGIADITGAFFAGLMISGNKDSHYIERRTDVTSYILFTPVFFAKVGLTSMDGFTSINPSFILFGVLFIIAGILGKLVGCGAGALACKAGIKDSLRCGIGMMCRAEVCLICAQKGIDAGIIDASIQPFILILILITSFATPVLLKSSYKGELAAIDIIAQYSEANKQIEASN